MRIIRIVDRLIFIHPFISHLVAFFGQPFYKGCFVFKTGMVTANGDGFREIERNRHIVLVIIPSYLFSVLLCKPAYKQSHSVRTISQAAEIRSSGWSSREKV